MYIYDSIHHPLSSSSLGIDRCTNPTPPSTVIQLHTKPPSSSNPHPYTRDRHASHQRLPCPASSPDEEAKPTPPAMQSPSPRTCQTSPFQKRNAARRVFQEARYPKDGTNEATNQKKKKQHQKRQPMPTHTHTHTTPLLTHNRSDQQITPHPPSNSETAPQKPPSSPPPTQP